MKDRSGARAARVKEMSLDQAAEDLGVGFGDRSEDAVGFGATDEVWLLFDDGEDAFTLIQKADTAMYQAKAAGIGKCIYFGMHEVIKTEEVTDV